MNEQRALLTHLFHVAVQDADPYQALKPYFPKTKPQARTRVIGFGKGAALMAQAFEQLWQEAGYGAFDGFIVTQYGQDTSLKYLDLMHAAHPIPDENSIRAGQRMMQDVADLGEGDQLIALVSGGGSALLAAPAEGLMLDDKIALNQALLASGAPIHVMNAIRAAASLLKGGRLSQLAGSAKIISYIISDVPSDDPALVSSGPTVAQTIKAEDVLGYIRHYNIALTSRLEAFFSRLDHDTRASVTSPDVHDFSYDEVYLVASARSSLLAARDEARRQGLNAILLSDAVEGEARDVALLHGALAREVKLYNQPFTKPVILLSGGETTVTLSSSSEEILGQGGRNSEFALALSQTIAGLDGITALIADTDGIDGTTLHAGAFCDGNTIARMHRKGIDPLDVLRRHDSASAFMQMGDMFTTGSTGTNINDFRAILIE